MKRTFILDDLCCANCAQKIQDKVSKLEGVTNCTVAFLTQKLTYDVEDDKNEAVEAEMRKIVNAIEPDVVIEAK